MRTKNAKRLWPVPVTLGVMALAALLAFGLMAANGAQPAAAQDDPDCTITVNADGSIDATNTTGTCDAVGDTAILEITGETDQIEDQTVSLLIEDKSGSITAYPNNTVWNTAIEPAGLADDTSDSANRASATKYRYQLITIPEAEANPTTGIVEGQKVTVMVQGNVLYWDGTESVTAEIDDIPTGNAASGSRQVAEGAETVDITFLGDPVVGKDGADLNKDIDDTVMDQCATRATSSRILAEAATNGCPSAGLALEPTQTWVASEAVTDAEETRSKLVIRTGGPTSGTGDASQILDGSKVTHVLSNMDDTVTIFALVQDSKSNNLLETPVDFVGTTVPNGIVATRDLSDDPETKRLVTSSPQDTDEEIEVTALSAESTADGSMVSLEAILTAGDAVAVFTLDDLPNGANDSYRITVEVMVGDVNLGTVIIARTGSPSKVVAGVFNIDCFDMGEADNYSDATFNDEKKGCDASGMANRFGHSERFVVKAHHEDELDLVVGDGSDLSAELSNEDDNLLGDAEVIPNDDPVEGGDPAQAWVFMVDDEASLGARMITVSTDATDKDDEAIADVMLSVTVAGPPHSYTVEGPMNIDLGDSGTFTVTAMDEAEDLPHFITDGADRNDLVEVFVADVPSGNVRGLDSNNMLELETDTGMGTFTVYAPRDAEQGEVVRFFVSSGDSEVSGTVMFGGEPMMPGMPGMPMNVMAEATSDTEITVSWDAVMDATSYMVERGYMGADNMKMWMTVAEMTMDTMYMDSGLMAETTYYYRVTAMNDAGSGDASDGMSSAMTMAEDMPPMTKATGITGSYLPAAKTLGVTWTPAADAEQQYIVLFSLPDYELLPGGVNVLGPDASSSGFTFDDGLAAGDYEVLVATFIDGTFYYDDDTAFMVTVE
jgi:hypothetical protein